MTVWTINYFSRGTNHGRRGPGRESVPPAVSSDPGASFPPEAFGFLQYLAQGMGYDYDSRGGVPHVYPSFLRGGGRHNIPTLSFVCRLQKGRISY